MVSISQSIATAFESGMWMGSLGTELFPFSAGPAQMQVTRIKIGVFL